MLRAMSPVDAYDHAGFSGLLVVNITKPEAHVTVGDDVVIKGGNVSISSEADNTVLFDDDSTAVGFARKSDRFSGQHHTLGWGIHCGSDCRY